MILLENYIKQSIVLIEEEKKIQGSNKGPTFGQLAAFVDIKNTIKRYMISIDEYHNKVNNLAVILFVINALYFIKFWVRRVSKIFWLI